jgi:hypothetical protein
MNWEEARGLVPHKMKSSRAAISAFRKSSTVKFLNTLVRASYTNHATAVGGAWFVPPSSLSEFWAICASDICSRLPLFYTETQSKESIDQTMCFFIDLDSKTPFERTMSDFLRDVVSLMTELITPFQPPPAKFALSVSISSTDTQFGCHVVLNNVLLDKEGRALLTSRAEVLWASTSWAKSIFIDAGASYSLRPILNSKVGRFPLIAQKPVSVNKGRVYDLLALFDWTLCNGFTRPDDALCSSLFLRPRPLVSPVQTFKVRNLALANNRTTFAEILYPPLCPDSGEDLVLADHLDELVALWNATGIPVTPCHVRLPCLIPRQCAVVLRDTLVDFNMRSSTIQQVLVATKASVFCSLALTSILPGAHLGALFIEIKSVVPPTSNPTLLRVPCNRPFLDALLGLQLDIELGSALFGSGASFGRPKSAHLLLTKNNEVVFVVLRLETCLCPRGGSHKSASREIWIGARDITLRCFSRRCVNYELVNRLTCPRKGVVACVEWCSLGAVLWDSPEDEAAGTDALLLGLIHTHIGPLKE